MLNLGSLNPQQRLAVERAEQVSERALEKDLCIHIFSVSAALVGVCLTVIGLHAESAAGLHWTAPMGWKAGPAQPMRA
jgi:uncharacterized membrane protein